MESGTASKTATDVSNGACQGPALQVKMMAEGRTSREYLWSPCLYVLIGVAVVLVLSRDCVCNLGDAREPSKTGKPVPRRHRKRPGVDRDGGRHQVSEHCNLSHMDRSKSARIDSYGSSADTYMVTIARVPIRAGNHVQIKIVHRFYNVSMGEKCAIQVVDDPIDPNRATFAPYY